MYARGIPNIKDRVRREDLRDSSPDLESSDDDLQNRAELEAKLRASLAGKFSFDFLETQPAPSATPAPAKASKPTKLRSAKSESDDDTQESIDGSENHAKPEEEQKEEFEFRLFNSAPTTKVALPEADDGAPKGDGAMVRRRPLSYYISAPLTTEQKAQFDFAAVSGEQVLERAKQRSWGMEMPWRVTHIGLAPKNLRSGTSTQILAAPGNTLEAEEEEKAKRKRPGKKRRIAARTREREAKKKAEAADKSKVTKEEHLREKKKRLNRQRKLKRRAKAKDAKGGDGEDGDSSDGSDDS